MGPDTASRTEVLFPELDPYAMGRLAVDTRHTLYWETCGNPGGTPLVFLHGGPGGASLPHHRRYYDPSFWRIVLFDQRGAGRSTPVADLTDNTTQHLVADLERLREHLRIEKWLLFGGRGGRPGARLRGSASGALPGLVPGGFFSRVRRSSTVYARDGSRSRKHGAFVEFFGGRKSRPSAELLPALTHPDAPCTRRRRLGPLRRIVFEAPAGRSAAELDSDMSTPRSRGSKRTTRTLRLPRRRRAAGESL
jgi:pimeloyl-ACP methyl ester carboxylesterase